MLPENKKILFFSLDHFDYLADGFLIGLKSHQNLIVYEYPGNKIVYKTIDNLSNQHGMAFTIGKVLDIKSQILYANQIPFDQIDLFVFPSIQHQYSLVKKFLPYLKKENTLILDGADSPSLFPYSGYFIQKPKAWFFPPLHYRFHYYKREWIKNEGFYSKLNKVLPNIFIKFLINQRNIRPISFSIPEGKIIKALPQKTKLFPKHIVDEEVANHIEGSSTKYAFDNEKAYYADLQASKFGITTKRAGWDCMRHYEIAANGAVICFKDLDKKPVTCAPHGLIDGVNCINYKNYEDLTRKIEKIDIACYSELQKNSFLWVKSYNCFNTIKHILNTFL